MTALFIATVLLPAVLGVSLLVTQAPAVERAVVPVAAVALLPGLFAAGHQVDLPWLLLGVRLAVDAVSAPLLLLAGLLWGAAAWYARGAMADDPRRRTFFAFFAVTLAGNTGVLLAGDLAGFYLAYAVMTFAAYPLVVHDRTAEAYRAGRVYLTMAVAAEAALLIAVLWIAAPFGNLPLSAVPAAVAAHPQGGWIAGLAVAAFAVKMGVAPLHVWLPLAHPAAPVAASAVLSGVLVKAGLVGWLRFLPLGEAAWAGLGTVCLVLGLTTAFYGVAVGVVQSRIKTVLAYSTISQMGLLTAGVGIALAAAPAAWPLLMPALLLFALHHGLAKGALFLAAGLHGRLRLGLLALPALSLTGLPPLAGFVAKSGLKEAGYWAPDGWVAALPWLLALSSVATMWLMARLLWLAGGNQGSAAEHTVRGEGGRIGAAGFLVAAALIVPWAWADLHGVLWFDVALTPSAWWMAVWPVAVGAGAAYVVARFGRGVMGRRCPAIPEGDLLEPVVALGRGVAAVARRWWARRPVVPEYSPQEWFWRLLAVAEDKLSATAVVGTMFILLVLGISLLGLFAGR